MPQDRKQDRRGCLAGITASHHQTARKHHSNYIPKMKNNTSMITKIIATGAASLALVGVANAQSCPAPGSGGVSFTIADEARNFQSNVRLLHEAFDSTLSSRVSRCTYTRQMHSAIKDLERHTNGLASLTRRSSSISEINKKVSCIGESLATVYRMNARIDTPRFFGHRLARTKYAFSDLQTEVRYASYSRPSTRSRGYSVYSNSRSSGNTPVIARAQRSRFGR